MRFARPLCVLSLAVLFGMCAATPRSVRSLPNTQDSTLSAQHRIHKLLDFGWRFHLGNASDMVQDFGYGAGLGLGKGGEASGAASPRFNDSDWREVNLPHDWVPELPFVRGDDGLHTAHGSKPIGRAYPATTIGWYRRNFDLPEADKGKRVSIEFDGVFRDSQTWLNGHLIGREPSGYSSFSYDVSDFVNFGGHNVLVVRVDASQYEGWFYEGAGIYRHVWLTETDPVHVAHWGTFVSSEVKGREATIDIQTEVQNDSDGNVAVDLSSSLREPGGKEVARIATNGTKMAPWSKQVFHQKVKIADPKLWSIETPQLYELDAAVSAAGSTDQVKTSFGIRTIAFDPDKGFFLNGKRVEIKGMCNHQDHAGVGSALPDRLQYFRIERLKEMGCNAYRTSHNPPTPELLDACDRLGMLVMDENRLLGSSGWILSQLNRQIKRDRNHPSVILWSIGNEEYEGSSNRGKRIAETMVRHVHELDPTRPTTYAGNNGNDFNGVNSAVDVRGWNYMVIGNIDAYHKAHPKQPMMGSEEASTLSTRGIYTTDKSIGYMSAYDSNKPGWGSTAEDWWKFYDARPWLAGAFVWTGFDYRGEPTPYGWPCISSHFGILDTCGFPKDNFYYYQTWWSGQDVLHILPHWNWAGKEGQNVDVWVYSNLDEVELFLNGKSLGRKTMPKDSHLEWEVPYQPGTLEARGYRKGQVVKTEKIETTGPAAKLVLTPDRSVIDANGEDVSVLTISAVDSKGRQVPVADNDVSFQVTGGKLIGVGNGNPSSHENDQFLPVDLDINTNAWRINLSPPKDLNPLLAPDYDDSDWKTTVTTGQADQLGPDSTAVFRSTFDMPGIEKGSKVTIKVGQIADRGSIYINGIRVGGTDRRDQSYSFDITKAAHAGRNSIVVVVTSGTRDGGLGRTISAHLGGPPPVWRRQLFNGLAQAIVQGTPAPGTIKVTATSPGLQPATIEIETKAAEFRGF